MRQASSKRMRLKMKISLSSLGIVLAAIVATTVVLFGDGLPKEGKDLITSEKNTALSELIYGLNLVSTAGTDAKTGAFFLKVYRVPQGGECDTNSDRCKGVDLLVSAASLDLDGDNALYRIGGLSNWEFVEWKKYAEFDSPESTTSFTVKVSLKAGKTLSQCRKTASNAGDYVTFAVNPWKISCEFAR